MIATPLRENRRRWRILNPAQAPGRPQASPAVSEVTTSPRCLLSRRADHMNSHGLSVALVARSPWLPESSAFNPGRVEPTSSFSLTPRFDRFRVEFFFDDYPGCLLRRHRGPTRYR